MTDATSTRRPAADRGLQAVARVRSVRERDSRAGLLQALASLRTREAELAELEQALGEATTRSYESLAEFAATRPFLDTTAQAVLEAQRRLTAGITVATEARSRWQADKTRVRAIEQLLEARAERARVAALRAEARETDDLVGGRAGRRGHTGDEGGQA